VDAADHARFYDPSELNGTAFHWGVERGVMAEWTSVNAFALSAPPGGDRPSVLVALLLPVVGRPRQGIPMHLVAPGGSVVRSAVTDRHGEFRMADVDLLPPGEYLLVGTDGGVWRLRLMEEEGIYHGVYEGFVAS
jgi:hypothetical protein